MQINLRREKRMKGGPMSEHAAPLIKDSMEHLSCFFVPFGTSAVEHVRVESNGRVESFVWTRILFRTFGREG